MTNELDQQIDFLEESVRKLKIKYDLFFAGVSKLPPTEERRRMENMIHEMSKSRIRDNGRRFRFNTLLGKYNMFRELWSRMMREREEGPMDYKRRSKALSEPIEPPKETPPPPRPRVTSEGGDSYVKVQSDSAEEMQKIFEQIAAANQKLGKEAGLTLDQVSSMVAKQAEVLRGRYGVRSIGFRVETVDGKIKLKAKPLSD